MRSRRSIPALAGLLLAAAACTGPATVTLRDVLRESTARRGPVILIHGALGATLADRWTGEVGWLTSRSAFRLSRTPDLRLPDPAVGDGPPDRWISVDLLREVPVLPWVYSAAVFEPLVAAFEEAGYRVGDCEFPRADEDAFVFHFDFRRDAVESARKLARAVERVRSTRADPEEKVSLVAHSFGGLVVRYYLMYGDADVLGAASPRPTGAGARNVERVAYLGSPHRGSFSVFQIALQGYRIGFNDDAFSRAVIATCPALYQAFPPPEVDCFLDETSRHGALVPYRDPGDLPLSLYDPWTWKRLGWVASADPDGSEASLDAAHGRLERFLARALFWWTALEAPWSPPAGLRTLSVGGTTEATPTHAFVRRTPDGTLRTTFEPLRFPGPAMPSTPRPLLVSTGDGRVTLESALALPFGRRVVSTAPHDFVHQDPTALDNVLLFLWEEELVGAPAPDQAADAAARSRASARPSS